MVMVDTGEDGKYHEVQVLERVVVLKDEMVVLLSTLQEMTAEWSHLKLRIHKTLRIRDLGTGIVIERLP